MKASLIVLVLVTASSPINSVLPARHAPQRAIAQDSVTAWRIAVPGGYTFDSSGTIHDPNGATLAARSTTSDVTSMSLSKSMPADTLRLRRIKWSGRMKTQDVMNFTSLWMRVDGKTGMLTLNNGVSRGLKGTNDWTPFEVTTVVPSQATRIVFGLLLSGTGSVNVEGLRITTEGVIDPKAPLADSPKKLLDAAIDVVRRNSVWRDTISWTPAIAEVRELAAGAQRDEDVYPALTYLARRLGDNHSGFFPPAVSSGIRSGGATNPIPEVRTVDNNIGYIRMEGYSGVERTAMPRYATAVHSRLTATKPTVTCGWIVDLRGNTGGNMNPMLAALRPFLGENALGYFISPTSRSAWSASTASDYNQIPRPSQSLDDLEKAPVAVLTGTRTASSGEIIAISFRGRKNTRSFGQPTGGYSTANSMFPLPGGSMMNVTTAIDADRNGVKFGHQIAPDVVVDGQPSAGNDPVQAAAISWLRGESKCSSPQTY